MSLSEVLWEFRFMNQNELGVPFLKLFTVGAPVKTFHEDIKGFVRQWEKVCMLLESMENVL